MLMISFPTPSVAFVCFGFSRDFICGFCPLPTLNRLSSALPSIYDPATRPRSRPHSKSSFTNPIQSTKHLSPSHFVPIRHSRSRSHSHHTRQPTFFGFLYNLVFAAHRLKRSSSKSFHPTLHHFTSILLNRGKLVTFVGLSPRIFLVSRGFPSTFTLHLRWIRQSSSRTLS